MFYFRRRSTGLRLPHPSSPPSTTGVTSHPWRAKSWDAPLSLSPAATQSRLQPLSSATGNTSLAKPSGAASPSPAEPSIAELRRRAKPSAVAGSPPSPSPVAARSCPPPRSCRNLAPGLTATRQPWGIATVRRPRGVGVLPSALRCRPPALRRRYPWWRGPKMVTAVEVPDSGARMEVIGGKVG